MIVVAGEALIDIVVGDDRSLTQHLGGAPFNVARFIARLGSDAMFLGTLSDDGFGDALRAELRDVGVANAVPEPVSAPTTLAIATLDRAGAADYRFYLEGTSAAALAPAMIPDDPFAANAGTDARTEGPGDGPQDDPRRQAPMLVLGGLGLVGEPCASTLISLLARVGPDVIVVLDPNCRPRAITDLDAYRARIDSVLGRVDLLKVSVDDLTVLRPELDWREAARVLAASGPAAVLVTDGAGPVTILTGGAASAGRDGTEPLSVPVPTADVVDTIGAGDSFLAGVVTWWTGRGHGRAELHDPDVLRAATEAAVQVSAAVCGCAGAELPRDFAWSAAVA